MEPIDNPPKSSSQYAGPEGAVAPEAMLHDPDASIGQRIELCKLPAKDWSLGTLPLFGPKGGEYATVVCSPTSTTPWSASRERTLATAAEQFRAARAESDPSEADFNDTAVPKNRWCTLKWWWTIMLIPVYMHFEAGFPIVQDIYKMKYGSPHLWGECDDLGNSKCAREKPTLLYTVSAFAMVQYALEWVMFASITRYMRGEWSPCLRWRRVLACSPASVMFGIQSIFGIIAQGKVDAGPYALYAQSGVVIVAIAWSIVFRKAMSVNSWIGILTVVTGLFLYNMSDAELSADGIVYLALKVLCQTFAVVYAERFLKSNPEDLYVQLSWTKPVELLTAIIFTLVAHLAGFNQTDMWVDGVLHEGLSPINAILKAGFFHHWNAVVIGLLFFNMLDTFLNVAIAKEFDSVVKGVANVASIIYPTLAFQFFMHGNEDWSKEKSGATAVIILGSSGFAFAKWNQKAMEKAQEELDMLRLEMIGDVSGIDK